MATQTSRLIPLSSFLFAALAFLVVAAAVAVSTSGANAATLAPAKAQKTPKAGGQFIGGGFSKCRHKRIFFENCWWTQTSCGSRIVSFTRQSCPDLPR